MNARQVILVYIAKNPDIGEIRDGEQVRRVVQRFHSGRGSDVLLDDSSGYGRADFDQGRGMPRVTSKKAYALLGGLNINVRPIVGVFGHLHVFLRRRSEIGRASCRASA